jgi:hypothetical protein
MDHFVFVFNHDATYLVHTSMVTSSRPFDLWFINPDKLNRPNDGFHIVFMPPQIANNTMIPWVQAFLKAALIWESSNLAIVYRPKLAYSATGMHHDGNDWAIFKHGGELAPGLQSTLFLTTFQCSIKD